jgi:hypothetical protein
MTRDKLDLVVFNVTDATSELYLLTLVSEDGTLLRDPVVQWGWVKNCDWPLPISTSGIVNPDDAYALLLPDGTVHSMGEGEKGFIQYPGISEWLGTKLRSEGRG